MGGTWISETGSCVAWMEPMEPERSEGMEPEREAVEPERAGLGLPVV